MGKERSDTLIRNAMILPMDDSKHVFDDGAIAIRDGKILNVGRTSTVEGSFVADETIDAKKMLILPGLINTHNHFEQSFLKGLTRLYTKGTFEWIQDFKIPFAEEMNPDDYYYSALLSCIEMIKAGTTCSMNLMCQQVPRNVMDFGVEKTVVALEDSGLKSVIAVGFEDRNEPERLLVSESQGRKLGAALLHTWGAKGHGQMKFWTGAAYLGSVSVELWKSMNDLASEYKTGLHAHMNDDPEARVIYDNGLMSSRTLFAHCSWISGTIRYMANSGAKVAVCPSYNYAPDRPLSELAFGAGIPQVVNLLNAGVTVSLGTDGCMGDAQDIFKEMRTLAWRQQYLKRDKSYLPPTKLLEMSTTLAAKALLWDDTIGSLETGKDADLIMIDLDKPHLTPWINTPASLVYLVSGSDVDTTMIKGKVVMKNRRLLTVDESLILAKSQETAESLAHRAGFKWEDKGLRPWCSATKT